VWRLDSLVMHGAMCCLARLAAYGIEGSHTYNQVDKFFAGHAVTAESLVVVDSHSTITHDTPAAKEPPDATDRPSASDSPAAADFAVAAVSTSYHSAQSRSCWTDIS
jgi:hypothetical protein